MGGCRLTNDLPRYLEEPDVSGRTHGTVSYDEKRDSWVVKAEPMVIELAKRVFPGSTGMGRGAVRFPATRRHVAELNWLMLRYPLRIKDAERWAADHTKAVEHALRREENINIPALTDPPPTFTGKLYPFQEKDVPYLVKNERALLANEMGLGKTIVALAGLAVTGVQPVLVVLQANLQIQWERMCGMFLALPPPDFIPEKEQARLDAGPAGGKAPMVHRIKGLKPYPLPPASIYLIHYGLLAKWKDALFSLAPQVVIFDEIQELRHPTTHKYSAASAIAVRARWVWGLSGTPIYNYGVEIWSVLNIIDFNCLGDSESFTREWCDGYRQQRVEKPEVLGDYLRREGLMLRRRKDDPEVRISLPPKRRVVHAIDSDKNEYARLVAQAVSLAYGYDSIKDWQEKGRTMREIEGGVRMASGVAKAPYVAGFVRGLIDAGERPLVCAHHHAVHDILIEHLKDRRAVRISGRETAEEKDAAVRKFAKGYANVVILALRSGAGLDGLQGRGTCVVFAELDWSPAIHSQLESRLHRIGMNAELESLLSYYMVSETGIDEEMQRALGLKVGQFVGIMGDKKPKEDDELAGVRAAEKHMVGVVQKLKEQFKGGEG